MGSLLAVTATTTQWQSAPLSSRKVLNYFRRKYVLHLQWNHDGKFLLVVVDGGDVVGTEKCFHDENEIEEGRVGTLNKFNGQSIFLYSTSSPPPARARPHAL